MSYVNIKELPSRLSYWFYYDLNPEIYFSSFGTIDRQRQSIQQIGALFLLIIAAALLSIGEGSSKASSSHNSDEILFYGIVPVLVASVLSGLASALCQWASQVSKIPSCLWSDLKVLYHLITLPIFAWVIFNHRLRNTRLTWWLWRCQ